MSTSDDKIAKFHRICKTLLQMLNDRGFLVTDDEINMTKEQFVEHYGENFTRESLVILKEKRNDSSDKILVLFPSPEPSKKSIGKKTLEQCCEKMELGNIFRAIIVVEWNLASGAKKFINGLPHSISIHVFLDYELMCNVTEHHRVPVHQALTPEEKKAVLDKYGVKETQLPRLLVTDPIARYYGFQHGQVVKIIRPSENAGRYITYRCVG